MKTPPTRGFTLVEIMIAVAIIGLLASLAAPKLMRAFQGASDGTADGIQGQIQGHYDNWVSLSGSHATLASSGVDAANLTLSLLDHLTSDPDETRGTFTPIAIGSDTRGIYEVRSRSPHAGTIRFKLSKPYLIETSSRTGGVPTVVYADQFAITFNATSRNTGTWTVTALE